MKAINRVIDRFCYNHPRFGISNLIKYVVFGTVIVYIITLMDTTNTFWTYLTFDPSGILRGQVWRLISFVFLPGDSNVLFFAISMYFYYMVGNSLEQYWGSGKFTIFYISGMVLTALYSTVYWLILDMTSISFLYFNAYYINLAMLFAFATVYAEMPLLIFGIIPLKAKWLGVISGALLLYDILSNWSSFPINLLPLFTLLNYFLFCGGDLLHAMAPMRYRVSPRTINFKKAAKKAGGKKNSGPVVRKCAVCGMTDTEHPDMEFRYCSRCEGFHCFCIDHINNHVHFDS